MAKFGNSEWDSAAGQGERTLLIRRLGRDEPGEIVRVAARMRATLQEVLGPEGRDMYAPDWLIDRVRFHVDPARSRGRVWLAVPEGGRSVGHVIARLEPSEGERALGLISTLYLRPRWRKRGLARRLLNAAEQWLIAEGAGMLAYDTAEDNVRMIRLLEERGYRITYRSAEKRMVRHSRPAQSPFPPNAGPPRRSVSLASRPAPDRPR